MVEPVPLQQPNKYRRTWAQKYLYMLQGWPSGEKKTLQGYIA